MTERILTPQLRELLEVVRYADYPGDADKAVEDIVALFSETAASDEGRLLRSVPGPEWYKEKESPPSAIERKVYLCPQCGTGMEVDPTAKPSDEGKIPW